MKNIKRKPTRRDLLIIIARLQDLVGIAKMNYEDDQNQFGLSYGRKALDEALDLCLDARSYDPPIELNGPWSGIING